MVNLCKILTPVLLLLVIFNYAESENILFFFGVATYSHRILAWTYVEKLAALGHQVTFLSGFKPKHPNPNVTEFHPQSLQDLMTAAFGTESDFIQRREDGRAPQLWSDLEELGLIMCDVLMKDPEYINFVKKTKFDLIVLDALHNDCALGIAKLHQSKLILFVTNHPFMWHYDMFGIPTETSSIPDSAVAYNQEMSYWERIQNTFWPIRWYFNKVLFWYPKVEAVINKGFGWTGDEKISLRDMELDTDLVLVNSHFSVDYARSLPPLFVPVCGLHIKKGNNKIPKDIQKFADESGDAGFIYVSFGSALQIAKAKKEIRDAFFYAFGNSTVRFIWKWDGPRPAEMPSNVLTAPWMPQADILAHPKVKAFITHAGLLGISEAITNSVPLITFPCFAEQDYNAHLAELRGYGIRQEFLGLKQHVLQDDIRRILTDPAYKENMDETSRRFMDRQNDPLDTAIWWTEYVLRNKKSRILLPMSRYQYWFTRRVLDVWGLLIGGFALLIGLLFGCRFSHTQNTNGGSRKQKKN